MVERTLASRASLPRLASVYSRPDGIVVHAHARTDAGAWIAALPAFRLGAEVGPAQLGTAVRTALSSGRHGVPMPAREHYREQLRPVSEAAGVKSWAALERGARLCTILQEGPAELRIVPTRNGGSRGDDKGFHDLPEMALTVTADVSAEVLGDAVRRALALSQAR